MKILQNPHIRPREKAQERHRKGEDEGASKAGMVPTTLLQVALSGGSTRGPEMDQR